MEPQGLNFFTPNEIEWLRTKWLSPFCQIDGRRLAESQGSKIRKSEGGKSQMQALMDDIREEFGKEFPYRLPARRGSKARSAELSHLRLTEVEWSQIGQVGRCQVHETRSDAFIFIC
jgi:hypothetical protein